MRISDGRSDVGSADLAHPTESLTLSMGGRYSHDRKKYDIATQVLVNGVQRSSFQSSLEESWAEFTPRLTVEYELSPSAMIYANYSQGYKAGGYNSRGTIPENVGPYRTENGRYGKEVGRTCN